MARVSIRARKRAHGTWLRDLILGGQDGLVNVLGISLGLSAVSDDVRVLIAAGLAATFAESASMGIQLTVIGLGAALVGFLAGRIFNAVG
jgi:VIT1/CCC1 family predicted Fe2+/Mn2+ transporter